MSRKKSVDTLTMSNIRAPKELFDRLDKIAEQNYISRNSVMLQALAAYCDQKDKEKKLTSEDEIKKMILNNPDLIKALADSK